MTREELERTHPLYDAYLSEWEFFVRSYFGGRLYREGGYLLKHPFESTENHNRRRATAYYYNYCGPIVDIMVSHLFRKPPRRDFGSLASDPLFNAFLEDCDLEGTGFAQFMRDAQRFASIYGRVSIVVDKPRLNAGTLEEEIRGGIRPYLVLITPENLLDWRFTRLPSGRTVLDMVKIREEQGLFRIWTRRHWQVWLLPERGEPVLSDSGTHPLGEVPIVNLYNKKTGIRMLGLSDIQDIADINRNIYYLCSDAREIIENTAFPMLAIPYEKSGVEEKEIGPRNILQFDPSEPNARPYWLEAPHSSLSEIREWVRQDIAEIHRIAKLGGVRATQDRSQPQSGIALELEWQQLHAVLSEKADNLEEAERQLLRLWARWQGKRFDGTVDYPDEFSVRDLDRELERAIKAISLGLESRTFRKELEKKVVDAVLPKLKAEVKTKILEEIDEVHREKGP